jgi:hypothetical protein
MGTTTPLQDQQQQGHRLFTTAVPFYKTHTHIKIQTLKTLANNLTNNFTNLERLDL